MNKYQEALNAIKTEPKIQDYYGDYINFFDKDDEDIALLQELVDKATPKKPIVQTFKSPYLKSYINKGFCPQCKKEVEEDNCCSNNDCRQAIDWSTDD